MSGVLSRCDFLPLAVRQVAGLPAVMAGASTVSAATDWIRPSVLIAHFGRKDLATLEDPYPPGLS